MKKLSQHRYLQGVYRTLVDEAYAAEKIRLKGDLPSKDTWRREINLATTQKYSTKEMNQSTDFDAVALELAMIAGNDTWINKIIQSAAKRYRYNIQQFIQDLEVLTAKEITWAYVQGICKQANYSTSIMDCPVEHLENIMKMLSTHVRRLAKKQGLSLKDLRSSYSRKEDNPAVAKAKWHHDHHHHVTHNQEEAVHA